MTTLVNLFRRILPTPLKQTAKKILGLPAARIHRDWAILESIGPVLQPHVIFDLGARNGWFFSSWKAWCPEAVVHAFEPDKAAFSNLQSRFAEDANVHLSPLGIGDEESNKTFYYMPKSEVSSSFLQHNPEVWEQLKYQTGKVEKRDLAITTLDLYVQGNNIKSIFLMKIDIQGYELRALQGGKATLRICDYILVESSIRPLYQDSASFTEVHDFMTGNDFHLINLRAWHRGNGVLMETDMLFRRNSLATEIDEQSGIDRIYISG